MFATIEKAKGALPAVVPNCACGYGACYLVNLAGVFECRLVDVCEEEWKVFDATAPKPPPKDNGLPER